jgi:hypothetical protein
MDATPRDGAAADNRNAAPASATPPDGKPAAGGGS